MLCAQRDNACARSCNDVSECSRKADGLVLARQVPSGRWCFERGALVMGNWVYVIPAQGLEGILETQLMYMSLG